jgi:hypothetical protein
VTQPKDVTPEHRLHLREQLTGFLLEEAQATAAYLGELQRQGVAKDHAIRLACVQAAERFRALYSPGAPRDSQP